MNRENGKFNRNRNGKLEIDLDQKRKVGIQEGTETERWRSMRNRKGEVGLLRHITERRESMRNTVVTVLQTGY